MERELSVKAFEIERMNSRTESTTFSSFDDYSDFTNAPSTPKRKRDTSKKTVKLNKFRSLDYEEF